MNKQMKWIRVDSGERPEDGEDFMVVERGKTKAAYILDEEWWDIDSLLRDGITHWAHLPEPPEREE